MRSHAQSPTAPKSSFRGAKCPSLSSSSSTAHAVCRADSVPIAKGEKLTSSLGDLQIEGIISRTPTPTPLEDRDPESLTVEEARELVRRQREQLAGMATVKNEKREHSAVDGDDEDSDLVVIEQRVRKRYRTSQDSGLAVIDLTEY